MLYSLLLILWSLTIGLLLYIFPKTNKKHKLQIQFIKHIEYLEKVRNSNIIFIVDEFWEDTPLIRILRKYIIDINDGDQFMRRFGNLKYKDIDIILHTNGGAIDSSDMIAKALLKYTRGEIRTHVPEFAFSAGTVIGLSGKLHMNDYSFLGPTDPQIDYENTENSDNCSSKILINLLKEARKDSKLVEIDSKMYIMASEAACLHKDNEITMNNALKKNHINCNKQEAMTLFVSGNYPHHKPIDKDDLNELNINVFEICEDINWIFQKFRLLRDTINYK